MTRGDYEEITFAVTNPDGSARNITTDTIKFSAKVTLKDAGALQISRDYRLETALNLLGRNGNIQGDSPENWVVVEPPQGGLDGSGVSRQAS